MSVKRERTIALEADPNDAEDGDVTVDAVEQALAVRRERRALRGAQVAPTKKPLSLRIDEDVLERWRASGRGWQSRMNEALRAAAP
jgi:uncharacterized protein (DUF4415 family)